MSSKSSREQHPASRSLFTYETAPDRIRERHGIAVISTKMLKRRVEAGRIEHLKIGVRVFFTDEQLDALVESFTVRAIR
ncbi:hypothetical protein M3667_14220 [Microbacterium sp. P26]|uniref:hypothetical protein n=1 Tax=Microbacterium TaxID=33882 RepID=UPI00204107DD|nr:hypothetical protein [Microbacterium sp. P26]MCM3503024.1 hypothetical protein [Microbacterium sp. P26]